MVRLLGCCLETQVPMLVSEFIENGTLHHHLHKDNLTGSMPWENRLRIAADTAGALAFLHSASSVPIIHRDVKSANILLDKNFTAKVAHFGASRVVPLDKSELTTRARHIGISRSRILLLWAIIGEDRCVELWGGSRRAFNWKETHLLGSTGGRENACNVLWAVDEEQVVSGDGGPGGEGSET